MPHEKRTLLVLANPHLPLPLPSQVYVGDVRVDFTKGADSGEGGK